MALALTEKLRLELERYRNKDFLKAVLAVCALAAHAVRFRQSPRAIRADKKLLSDFQNTLRAQGVELAWPQIHPV